MVTEQYDLVKTAVPNYQATQLQLKVHTEAPVGGLIRRDNFVALTTQAMVATFYVAYAQVYQIAASRFLQAVDFTGANGADRDTRRRVEPLHDR
jgi:hypothetical protein